MAQYIDPSSFLPLGTKNTLMSRGAWNVDELDWEELINTLEASSISTVKALINYKMISDDHGLMRELVSKYVISELMTPLIHMADLQERGFEARDQFNRIIESLQIRQEAEGYSTDDKSDVQAGLIVF